MTHDSATPSRPYSREEVAAIHAHIPTATAELDAAIAETATATTAIMDACERLQQQSTTAAPSDLTAAITREVTAIFEACSFQDITGQRITKVIKTLKNIEDKAADILQSLGYSPAAELPPPVTETASTGLVNGPQLDGEGMSQADIDKLLAGLD